MRRLAGALLTLPLLLAGGVLPVRAAGTTASAFDASDARGGCAAVEVTVDTGYSFIVEPDLQLPRATAAIEEGQSQAIASPADPGDSVDALAGLGIPMAEGYMNDGYPGAPPPFNQYGLSKLPAPFNGAGQALVDNPFNQTLTYPYEHADAGYPNPAQPGTQTATLDGAPDAQVTDPTGLFHVDGSPARAVAGETFTSADAGYGVAAQTQAPATSAPMLTIPSLGISIGRVSAHSAASVGSSAVSQDAVCELDGIDIAPPGAAPLHIGALLARVHTERSVSAATATASHQVEFSGVTYNGQGASLDDSGLTAGGQHVPFTLPPQQQSLPGLQGPTSVALNGTTVGSKQPNPDEASVNLTGATIVIKSSAPIPNAIPPSGVGFTPVTWTIRLASLGSTTYAVPAASALGSLPLGGAGFSGGAFSGGSAGTPATTIPGRSTVHPGSSGLPAALASVFVDSPLRWMILSAGALLEALLLSGAITWIRRRRLAGAGITETLDLP